jgi:acetyl/propionyl-CoA carboxylase alpha subunit
MKQIEVEVNGQTVKGYAVMRGGVLWTHANGETWTTETSSKRRGGRAGAASTANPGEITAPMPGKIIKISAPVGSEVKAGDVIIVMEAMKMEYTLKAQAAGRVSEVRSAAGDQVTLGAVLAKLEISK